MAQVMVAVPGFTEVTTTWLCLPATVATVGSDELQAQVAAWSGWPARVRGVACRVACWPRP